MDTETFIRQARERQTQISQAAMAKRQKMEELMNQMNMELGEANGQMRMLDELIELAEQGLLWGLTNDCQLSHATLPVVDTNQR